MTADEKRCLLADLGDRIAAAREARGMKQTQVAEMLGVSDAYVSLIERGQRNPPIVTLARMAKVLRVPLWRLA